MERIEHEPDITETDHRSDLYHIPISYFEAQLLRNNLVISRQKMMSLFFQITDTLYLRMSIRRVQLTGGPPWGLRLTGGAEGSQGLKVKHFLSSF